MRIELAFKLFDLRLRRLFVYLFVLPQQLVDALNHRIVRIRDDGKFVVFFERHPLC